MGCKSGADCLIPHRTGGKRLIWYLDSWPGAGRLSWSFGEGPGEVLRTCCTETRMYGVSVEVTVNDL